MSTSGKNHECIGDVFTIPSKAKSIGVHTFTKQIINFFVYESQASK